MLNGEVCQGLNALGVLYKTSWTVSSVELAEKAGSTVDMMNRIMGKLVKAGMVRSLRGPTGGYLLTDQQCENTIIEVVKILGQDIPLNDGHRLSDFANRALYDALDVKLCNILNNE